MNFDVRAEVKINATATDIESLRAQLAQLRSWMQTEGVELSIDMAGVDIHVTDVLDGNTGESIPFAFQYS